ncbi:MAG TPA: LLM class flavin-dependent oxidoreductase, partial [Thermomicrobiales bacterium]|nr:LLM class flavin-dependent oxidoreductase [Thermomicrobiales bacterium]
QEVAREAERLGYSSFWCNDTPGNDGLAGLAAAAAVTERIKLGVGVIPLDRRPPEIIAKDLEALDVPQERLLLGIGSGGDRRVSKVREGIEQLHELVSAPVIVGALGPKMTSVGGAVGDGVLFNWQTPETAQSSGQICRDAASAVGRPQPLVMAYVRTALLPQADDRLNTEAGRYSRVPAYAAHFERMGVSARDTAVSGPDAATLQPMIAAHEASLDETVIRAITADDTAASILELLRACAP